MADSPATRPDAGGRARRAGARPPRWRVRHFGSIDSTNRYLLDEARAGAPAGTVAVADHQTAGRGRQGRTWEAAPGSALLVSVLLRPDLPAERLGLLTMAAGVALADAVASVAGVPAGLKWPNDLVVGDRKLAGLLAEADLEGAAVQAVVIGAGCNLTAAAIPAGLEAAATALEPEAGRPVARDALLDAFLDAFAGWLDQLDAVPDEYRSRSATLGCRVRVETGPAPGATVEGEALDVTDAGALVVRDAQGHERTLAVGDVVHLRALPADDLS